MQIFGFARSDGFYRLLKSIPVKNYPACSGQIQEHLTLGIEHLLRIFEK